MVKRLDDSRIRTAFDFFDRCGLRAMERAFRRLRWSCVQGSARMMFTCLSPGDVASLQYAAVAVSQGAKQWSYVFCITMLPVLLESSHTEAAPPAMCLHGLAGWHATTMATRSNLRRFKFDHHGNTPRAMYDIACMHLAQHTWFPPHFPRTPSLTGAGVATSPLRTCEHQW